MAARKILAAAVECLHSAKRAINHRGHRGHREPSGRFLGMQLVPAPAARVWCLAVEIPARFSREFFAFLTLDRCAIEARLTLIVAMVVIGVATTEKS